MTVFRDEQTFLLSEFLGRQVKDYRPPQLERKAIVHGHCHYKNTLRFHDEESVLKKMGSDYTILDSGCCGMAGAFGYDRNRQPTAPFEYIVAFRCSPGLHN